MAGVALLTLTDKELAALGEWYLAHLLAGENSAADDKLDAKLKGYAEATACLTKRTSRVA